MIISYSASLLALMIQVLWTSYWLFLLLTSTWKRSTELLHLVKLQRIIQALLTMILSPEMFQIKPRTSKLQQNRQKAMVRKMPLKYLTKISNISLEHQKSQLSESMVCVLDVVKKCIQMEKNVHTNLPNVTIVGLQVTSQ